VATQAHSNTTPILVFAGGMNSTAFCPVARSHSSRIACKPEKILRRKH
jgi:hypothetical protein